jgi:hypothetical protein
VNALTVVMLAVLVVAARLSWRCGAPALAAGLAVLAVLPALTLWRQLSWPALAATAAVLGVLGWNRWARSAGLVTRCSARTRRKAGVASTIDVTRRGGGWAMRRRAGTVRPCLAGLSRWRRLVRLRTSEVAVRLCRAGLVDARDMTGLYERFLDPREEAQPSWAVEAFGPPPEDGDEREGWARRAGIVAAYRELRGHDDPADALGPAPKPGQVEAYAADQAAATHRRNAALRAAEAAATSEPGERARLEQQAADAAALAATLDARAAELQQLDDARARWLAHTAATRAAADRAKVELGARHVDDAQPDQQVTAEEWLATQRAAEAAEDPHRPVTHEAELADERDARDADLAAARAAVGNQADTTRTGRDRALHDLPEAHVPDIRDIAAAEPPPVAEDDLRVPTAEETSAALERAQRAVAEIQVVEEAREAAEHRADQLARWHAPDQAAEAEAAYTDAVERELPALGAADRY